MWGRLRDTAERPSTVVVVEGERDRRALTRLGLTAPIALAHRGVALAEVAHRLGKDHRRAILLTDWDRTGGQIARRLGEFLAAEEVEVDLDLRRRIGHALRGEVVHVEGLAGWAIRLAERVGTTWALASGSPG